MTIKASCPSCGDIELTPVQLRLVVCSVKAWSYYEFTCPNCLEEVREPATRDVIGILLRGQVIAEPWVVPAEAVEEHYGPTISIDDVLDFALWVDGADLVSAAAAALILHPRVTTPAAGGGS